MSSSFGIPLDTKLRLKIWLIHLLSVAFATRIALYYLLHVVEMILSIGAFFLQHHALYYCFVQQPFEFSDTLDFFFEFAASLMYIPRPAFIRHVSTPAFLRKTRLNLFFVLFYIYE